MPAEGLETLILFATPSPADFERLYQPPMRTPHRAAWSLNEVLDLTFHGGYGYIRSKEDWATISRTFRLRSRNAAQTVA